jgi:hypothetical protein
MQLEVPNPTFAGIAENQGRSLRQVLSLKSRSLPQQQRPICWLELDCQTWYSRTRHRDLIESCTFLGLARSERFGRSNIGH